MRPTRFYSLTLIASAVTLILAASCKKSSNSNSNSISATVGTTSVSGAHTVGTYSSSMGAYFLVSYNVQGKDTSGFLLTIPKMKAGTIVSSDSTMLTISYVGTNNTQYDAYNGLGHATLVLAQLDSVGHRISGNFSAVAYDTAGDSVVIKNGVFNTSYIAQ